jgi:endonuclease-8
MPEGPSIVILKELVQPLFTGKKILEVSGNSKIDQERLRNQKITEFKSWGKHFLICFKPFTLKVHFLMFGSYRINETKDKPPRLHMGFKKGEFNLYTCSIKFLDEPLDALYDWEADVMSDAWNPKKAKAKLKANPDMLACDALLNQDIFAGVGNIIKNEVLFRIKVHPLSKIGALPARKLNLLIKEARIYSFDFLEWKKQFVLKMCPRCNIPFTKQHLGKTHRKSFFCDNCQALYE